MGSPAPPPSLSAIGLPLSLVIREPIVRIPAGRGRTPRSYRLCWINVPGQLSQLRAADLDGDGSADLAGLTATGQIFYSSNLLTWTHIPGTLSQLLAGDLDGDGQADLAGLTSTGQVFYSTNLATWNHIPGTLAQLILLQ